MDTIRERVRRATFGEFLGALAVLVAVTAATQQVAITVAILAVPFAAWWAWDANRTRPTIHGSLADEAEWQARRERARLREGRPPEYRGTSID